MSAFREKRAPDFRTGERVSDDRAAQSGSGIGRGIREVAGVLAEPRQDPDELDHVVLGERGIREHLGVEGAGRTLDERRGPASVSTSIAARPSTGCGSRTTNPSRTSRSTVFVTLVGCTCSRAMALAIGIRPWRVKPSRRSISYRANDSAKGFRAASMRAMSSCCARMIDVTTDMPAAASVQPCADHWRFASAIGIDGQRSGLRHRRPPFRLSPR